MRVISPTLVLGGAGLVGTALRELLVERGLPFAAPARGECDITASDEIVRSVQGSSAQLVINCAAYNAVDRAEHERDEVWRINALGPETVARVAPAIVHYSTDYVFDGHGNRPYTESDTPLPLSAYGRAKLAGDLAVRAANPCHFVLRVGCIYGRAGRGFPTRLIAKLRAGERVRADGERRLQPTWARCIAERTLSIAANEGFGLYHLMCHGDTTWADFAREAARLLGRDPALVESVPTAALSETAVRPRYALLANRALEASGADRMPTWQDALAAYLASEPL